MRGRLPDHHLNAESKDVIRLATAVVGTLSALALGLLIASAKSSYDNAEVEMRTAAARVLLLDRVMAQYGPETDKARQLLRKLIEKRLSRGWTAETTDETSGNAPGNIRISRQFRPTFDPWRRGMPCSTLSRRVLWK